MIIKSYLPNEAIYCENEIADSFMIIISGCVFQSASSLPDDALDCVESHHKVFVRELGEGDCIDVESFFSQKKRQCHSYAKSNVKVFFITRNYFDSVSKDRPLDALEIYKKVFPALSSDCSKLKKNAINLLVKNASNSLIDETVKRSEESLVGLIDKTDDELDSVIKSIAKAVMEKLEQYATDEVNQTGIGNPQHKKHKLELVCNRTVNDLLGVRTIGCLDRLLDQNVVEYASPIGILFSISPLTNPITNSLFNALNAIKTRNALIVSYPKKAIKLGEDFVRLIGTVLEKHGLSRNILQVVPQPSSRTNVHKFMSHDGVNKVLATGGASLVKAAYSSGTPCLGVGPGNAPSLVFSDANIEEAARFIVMSKEYDNGIICGSENNLLVDENVYDKFLIALEEKGAAVLSKDEVSAVVEQCFSSENTLLPDVIGVDAKSIANRVKIYRPYKIKVLVIPAGREELWLAKEKLAPLLSIYKLQKNDLIPFAKTILDESGAGHTASIFSNNKKWINEFAESIPAGRLLVNTPSTFGMMGVSTDLPLSFMLGSGSWGENSTTDAVTWRDFINVKRLARHTCDVEIDNNENNVNNKKEENYATSRCT